MAICPQHGGYTGDGGCKKCQPSKYDRDEVKRLEREIELSGDNKFVGNKSSSDTSPEIDADDQLALYRLEREITAAQQKAQLAQGQFQNFVKVMFEKYGVKPAEFTLDMEKMEFTAREK